MPSPSTAVGCGFPAWRTSLKEKRVSISTSTFHGLKPISQPIHLQCNNPSQLQLVTSMHVTNPTPPKQHHESCALHHFTSRQAVPNQTRVPPDPNGSDGANTYSMWLLHTQTRSQGNKACLNGLPTNFAAIEVIEQTFCILVNDENNVTVTQTAENAKSCKHEG